MVFYRNGHHLPTFQRLPLTLLSGAKTQGTGKHAMEVHSHLCASCGWASAIWRAYERGTLHGRDRGTPCQTVRGAEEAPTPSPTSTDPARCFSSVGEPFHVHPPIPVFRIGGGGVSVFPLRTQAGRMSWLGWSMHSAERARRPGSSFRGPTQTHHGQWEMG